METNTASVFDVLLQANGTYQVTATSYRFWYNDRRVLIRIGSPEASQYVTLMILMVMRILLMRLNRYYLDVR